MNKLIQELYIKTLSEECSNPALVDIEKFAELIVQECAYIARQCYTVRAVEAEDVAKHIETTFRS